MKALITGGNGFIGSTLVEALLRQGAEIRCLVRRSSDLQWLQGMRVEYVYADLRDPASLAAALAGVDRVYHLAGVTKARNREGYIRGNYQATANLLAACSQRRPEELRFIFISSLAAAGPSPANQPLTEDLPAHPISLYGESKLMAEAAVLEYARHHPAVIIRPPAVYGPRDRDVFVYFKSIQTGFLFLLGSGNQQISLVHVDDLVRGILLAGEAERAPGNIYYLSGDGQYDWNTIGRTIARALNKKPLTVRVPAWLLNPVAAVSVGFSRLGGKPALLNWDKVNEMKQPGWLCSSHRAERELGYAPQVTLETGVNQTAAWYRQQGWL